MTDNDTILVLGLAWLFFATLGTVMAYGTVVDGWASAAVMGLLGTPVAAAALLAVAYGLGLVAASTIDLLSNLGGDNA